jgi:sulfopyruvate decarboxylase subunit alpha
LGIPYDELADPSSVAKQVRDAQSLAESSLAPVALLLTRSLMWED